MSLLIPKEDRKISKIFDGVENIDKELLSACDKEYEAN